MEEKNPYQTPDSELNSGAPEINRDRSRGRRAYLFQLFMIWIVLPALASFIVQASGLGEGGIREMNRSNPDGRVISSGWHLDILYVWYLQIPLFIYYTRNRVLDTGLNPWFTALFMLPVINIALWFWPPKN